MLRSGGIIFAAQNGDVFGTDAVGKLYFRTKWKRFFLMTGRPFDVFAPAYCFVIKGMFGAFLFSIEL